MTTITVHTFAKDTGSRDSGKILREKILALLDEDKNIQIDFEYVTLTPSFADEAIGLLSNYLSFEEFKRKIKLTNVSEQQKSLLNRVIANRFSKK